MKKKVDKSHKFLRNLKAQGLSLNTIIVAAIVLIVLIVLWAIFTGKMGSFTGGLAGTTEGQNACNDICKAAGIYKNTGDLGTAKACEVTTPESWDLVSVIKSNGQDKACCCQKKGTAA